jgi:hypothetical protein
VQLHHVYTRFQKKFVTWVKNYYGKGHTHTHTHVRTHARNDMISQSSLRKESMHKVMHYLNPKTWYYFILPINILGDEPFLSKATI